MALADNTDTFFDDAVRAVDTLVLEGLLHNDDDTFVSPTDTDRSVIVSTAAIDWLDEHTEELNSLYIMLDTDTYESNEMAVA
jgi:trans-aconitate methyltransferase